MSAPTVIFQVTAIGRNVRALESTVESVRYWVRRTPHLTFRYLLWVVVEPEGYATDPALYDAWRADGVKVWVVPKEFATPLGTSGKARALEYACGLRRRFGLSTPNVWVYHQDEETCVGEDTLLGIADFVEQREKLIGAGLILYPLDWVAIPSHVQEFSRSYDDLRVLDSLTLPGNPTAGFHGSHFIARADVEDSVGWDDRGYAPAEDLTFEIRVRARFGSVFGVLKGFAYEKGAFTLADQLRQRRRWVRGILYAFRRAPVRPRARRLTIVYSAASWFSALPSLAILVASVALHYGPMLLFTSFFTGFIWASMVIAYVEGARVHAAYVRSLPGRGTLVVLGILGALVDIVAPWYALFTHSGASDFVRKDPIVRAPDPVRKRWGRVAVGVPHPRRGRVAAQSGPP